MLHILKMKRSSGAVLCDARSFSASQSSVNDYSPARQICCSIRLCTCAPTVLQNVHLTLTSHKTENSEFCWQTFTIINDSKKPGMKVTLLCDHHIFNQGGREEADPKLTIPRGTGTSHVSIEAPLLDLAVVMGSALVILCLNPWWPECRMCLSGPSFPESSLFGSVTASSLILSRDHNRWLEHSRVTIKNPGSVLLAESH